ncbi:MFS transporter [Paenibacillus sp. SC116]|uniref:MFS transporter n=1 Tax=Paenibacillus sp. SC116 TaxID=2968986 RepID=UPI00215AE059|nr:MFS transporter [Paenibacillus sp. SC116]MCR8842413.1 MFS transporter [Paenibacillus sp. SC116]
MALEKSWKRTIALFMTSQTVSMFGSTLVQYAIMWHIVLTTQSGIMSTIYIICGLVPTFLLSPFAGVWADRYNRKKLILLSDSTIALSTLLLAILFLAGYDSLWMLFVISSIRAFGAGVQTPTVGALLPQLTPSDKLTKVNGINNSLQSFVFLLSPMLSGALLTIASIEFILFIDVITAAIAVLILLLFVRVPDHDKVSEQQSLSYFEDMRSGFAYINKQRYVKTFFIYTACFMILVAPVSFLTPLQVTRSFGSEVWKLTAIEIVFSIGMIAGGLLVAFWGGFKNKIHTMALSSVAIGICTFALGIVPLFWIYLIFAGITGVAVPFFNTPSNVLLQQNVEENYMGRVYGVYGMLSTSMMPLSMLVFGPVADLIPIEWILIGTGILLFAQGLAMFGSRALVEAGEAKS